MKLKKILLLLLSLSLASTSFAATKKVKAKTPSGYKLLVLSKTDGTVSQSSGSGSVEVAVSKGKQGRLYLVNSSTGALGANVILAIKKNGLYYTWKQAKSQGLCTRGAKAVYGFNVRSSSANLGNIKLKSGYAYTTAVISSNTLDKSALGTVSRQCVPTANASTLGIGSSTRAARIKRLPATSVSDSDSDGLVNALDADDDSDGVLDSYDPDTVSETPPSGTLPSTFKIFSNIKPEIQSSLNAYTETITDTAINNLIQNTNLAIQVAGGSTLATELDCGALSYCSTGGTGFANSSEFPEAFDGDSDGKGTITPGGTGDFQLTTGASKTSIGGGDLFVQEVTNADSTVTLIPGMLSFVFNTTPAVASLTMGSTTVTPVYPATNSMVGTANNPFTAPAGWDKKLTVTAYRPQREGISGAGEGALVDIGNSNISIDIPNNPCTGSGGCPGQNTSRCTGSSYTESDSNLSADGDKLKDSRADQDTDTSNPTANQVTFTVDLSTCISDSWDSGEKMAIDLQFSNSVGDNAAQKFYIQLP